MFAKCPVVQLWHWKLLEHGVNVPVGPRVRPYNSRTYYMPASRYTQPALRLIARQHVPRGHASQARLPGLEL